MTLRHGFLSNAMSMTVQLQIHEECCGRPAMSNQVAHQGVDHVRIRFHIYSNYSYSTGCLAFVFPPLLLETRGWQSEWHD